MPTRFFHIGISSCSYVILLVLNDKINKQMKVIATHNDNYNGSVMCATTCTITMCVCFFNTIDCILIKSVHSQLILCCICSPYSLMAYGLCTSKRLSSQPRKIRSNQILHWKTSSFCNLHSNSFPRLSFSWISYWMFGIELEFLINYFSWSPHEARKHLIFNSVLYGWHWQA